MDGFLAEIAAAPDDDLPRLVYADWLEERGDPRGEFIRVQCELAKDPADSLLQAREAELLEVHRDEWAREIERTKPTHVAFRRGFIDSVTITGENFTRHAGRIFSSAPLISSLVLVLCHEQCPELELIPQQSNIRSLHIHHCNVDQRGAEVLATLKLKSLSIVMGRLGLDGILALSRSPHLKEIESLHFTNCMISDPEVQVLADDWQPTQLRSLTLCQNQITDTGLNSLVSSPALIRLNKLDLYQNQVRLQIPSRTPAPLYNLHTLDLSQNALDIASPRLLGECESFTRLKTLKMANCNLGVHDITALLPLRMLTELDLGENRLGDSSAVAMAHCANFHSLRKLSLRECELGDIAAQALVASPFLKDLDELDLANNDFNAPSQRALRERFGPRVMLASQPRLM